MNHLREWVLKNSREKVNTLGVYDYKKEKT